MVPISAVELVYRFSQEEVWELPDDAYLVQFDDGFRCMTNREIVGSWYYWELYRRYPGAPLIKNATIAGFNIPDSVMDRGLGLELVHWGPRGLITKADVWDQFTDEEWGAMEKGLLHNYDAAVHLDLGSLLFWHVYYNCDHYSRLNHGNVSQEAMDAMRDQVWKMSRLFYQITNTIYNTVCTKMSEYVTSACIYDILEVVEDPRIVEAKAKAHVAMAEADYHEHVVSESIKSIYKAVGEVLYKNPFEYMKNGVKRLCMAGIVSRGQINQLVGIRGAVSDVDNYIYRIPVEVGYAEGITNTYDVMTESRSASRSRIMNTTPLQASEWFNREIQLAACVIDKCVYLGPHGCSGYATMKYQVDHTNHNLLKGKYYMEGDTPVRIWDSIDHLIGKTIEVRSITGCGCEDPKNVCSVCLGWTYLVIPPRTNLGFELSTPVCGQITNTIMSNKHLEGSSESIALKLDAKSSIWFRQNPKVPGKVYLTEHAVKGPLILRIENEYVENLVHILNIDVSEVLPARITKIPRVAVVLSDRDGSLLGDYDILNTNINGEGVHFTPQVLQYLKDHGWGSGRGFIEVCLRNWNANTPIFEIPRKSDNIMVFFNQVKSFIKPEGKAELKLEDIRSRGKAFDTLVSIFNQRLHNFNAIQVEILLRSMMVVDKDNKQYQLPRPEDPFEFVNMKSVIHHRCLPAMLAYQEQTKYLFKLHWRDPERQQTWHLLEPIIKE